MIFTNQYSLKMPVSQALLTAVFGIVTVLVILAIINGLIFAISKTIQRIEKRTNNSFQKSENVSSELFENNLELDCVDKKTAAIVMSIIAFELGIDAAKLDFKSIKAIKEDKT